MPDTIYTNCLYCNKELTKKTQTKFCSVSCSISLSNTKRLKALKPSFKCLNCDKILVKWQKKFCSSSCSAKVTNILKRKPKIKCLICKNDIRKGGKSFCSPQCSGLYDKIQTNLKIENGEKVCLNTFKRYLIETNGHQCESCSLTGWLGISITLEIHHIDGDRSNNSLDNLKILCPNCHSQTDNYCGKNIGNPLGKEIRQKRK